MRNMKMKVKLILGFAIVTILAVIVGVVGIVGMQMITKADTELYEINTVAVDAMGKIREVFQRQRVQTRNLVLFDTGSSDWQDAVDMIASLEEDMKTYMAEYEATITNMDDEVDYFEAKTEYETVYKEYKTKAAQAATREEGMALIDDPNVTAMNNLIMDSFSIAMENNSRWAKERSGDNDALAMTMLYLIIGVLVVAVAMSMTIALYIAGLISRPVKFMRDMLEKIGTQGDLHFSDAEMKQTEAYATAKDEVGDSVGMLLTTVRRLVEVGHSLEQVADGDLTAEVKLLSETDTMGISLMKMVDNLNDMFGEINAATAQVNTGAKQIADGAQSLAQGSTEQASSVEELSASISEIADQTNQNAGMARDAAVLSNTIKDNAEKGSSQMDNLMQAVREINEASGSISRVIKAIEDIAFQTNILALNAAVEAARAGQHGKGFAVVAEEVRNLAAKSAAAAKDSGGLIENSIEKANYGLNIATETADSLRDIVEGINKNAEIIMKIATSSEEQAGAITQVNTGIDQVAQVVQQNSATAEQSAAASEEMSGQSNLLEQLISQFRLRDGNSGSSSRSLPTPRSAPREPSSHEKNAYQPGGSGSFGKY